MHDDDPVYDDELTVLERRMRNICAMLLRHGPLPGQDDLLTELDDLGNRYWMLLPDSDQVRLARAFRLGEESHLSRN